MPEPSTPMQSTSPEAPLSLPPPNRSGKSALMIVFLVVFIDLLGFGIVIPLLPRWGEEYVVPLVGNSWIKGLILAPLMASFSAMQFIFAPIWGRISDRVGRRPILLLGLAASFAFYLLFGYAAGQSATAAALALTLLFAARIGAGVAGATIPTAQAVIADCTTPERRKHGMALIGAAFGIGFTFGPLVGAACLWWAPKDALDANKIAPFYRSLVGYSAAGLSLLALVLGLVLLPETRRFENAPPLQRKWFDLRAARDVLRSPMLGPIVLIFFLATLGFGSFEPTLALLIKDVLGLREDDAFLLFAYIGFVLVMTQGFLYRRLANRLSEVTFMAMGISLMALGLLLLGILTWVGTHPSVAWGARLGGMLASMTIAVIGFAFLTPSAQALLSRRGDPNKQGELLGVNQSAAALARILGPLFGIGLYFLPPERLLPYVFGAALLLLMLPILPRLRREEPSSPDGLENKSPHGYSAE